jgi:hypothetical protein
MPTEPDTRIDPLVVRSHVTPWGFLVALPLALAFAYVGALTLDVPIVPQDILAVGELPVWLFSAILIGFALVLFLVGVSELAAYLKPSVELVMDDEKVTTWGVLGERRCPWSDIVGAEIGDELLVLRARDRKGGTGREVRLHFNRLAIAPSLLLGHVLRQKPDIHLVARKT